MGKYQDIKNEMMEDFEAEKASGSGFRAVCRWVYRLRSLLLAIPVAVAAIILAIQNFFKLPPKVGFDLQSTGEFSVMMDRPLAVLIPLVVTGLCLLLMAFSKRVVYPWLVSLFSLLVPIVILFVNTFPG